ncbi:MAG: hypothetical protein WAN82_03495 [Candidatus Bathyarchaeia archaeon]
MENPYMLDIATMFHSLLFAYQKSVKELLGSGSAIFVHPTIETLNKIEKKRGLNLFQGKSLDEVYANLSNFFLKTGVVKEFTFEKVGVKGKVKKGKGKNLIVTRSKGKPIFCGSDGEWKVELEQRLQKDDEIVLLALGDVKYEVLSYLNKRKDIEILKLETRQMKKRDKGTGLKATVRSRRQQKPYSKQAF